MKKKKGTKTDMAFFLFLSFLFLKQESLYNYSLFKYYSLQSRTLYHIMFSFWYGF